MRIARVVTSAHSVPLPFPFDGAFAGRVVNPVIVRLTTEDGLEGFGLAIAWNDKHVRALKETVVGLSELMVGQDIYRGAEAWQKLWKASGWMGHQGYGIYALSAIDTALWSLRAQALGLPLARLLGGFREEIPAYASHLLFRNWSIDELQRDAAALVEQGFRVMKMNMGGGSVKEEVERIKAVREAAGQDAGIMVDTNFSWTLAEAIRIGREIEPYGVYWLEDPLASDDPDDLGRLRQALNIPIAAGENRSGKRGFRPLLDKAAVDVLMIDLQCAGGITEWMKVAALAEAYNVPVTGHLFHDYSVHLMCAVPNGTIAEYMPWWDAIYQEPPKVENGLLRVPDRPGLGLDLDEEKLRRLELK